MLITTDRPNMRDTNVLILTSTGPTPYFFCRRTLRTVASSAFSEEMLSANRQLMGKLGLSLPSNEILLAASRQPSGRSFLMSGLSRMPSLKSFSVSVGTEYAILSRKLYLAGVSDRVSQSKQLWAMTSFKCPAGCIRAARTSESSRFKKPNPANRP